MKRIFLSLALSAATSIAMASGFTGNLNIGADVSNYTGSAGGYSQAAIVGGSMAQGNVNNTGISAQFTSNEGLGMSGAGAAIGREGVVTYTAGVSQTSNVSGGFTAGRAAGSTAGAVGVDFTADAWGGFETNFTAIDVNVNGFGQFGTW